MSQDRGQQQDIEKRRTGTAGEILRIIVVGFTGMATAVLTIYAICMLLRYGVKDLNKRDYLETARFEQSLIEQLEELDSWLNMAHTYEGNKTGGSVVSLNSKMELSYASDSGAVSLSDSAKPGIRLSRPVSMTYEQFINNSGNYQFGTDQNGTVFLTDTGDEYNANWYSAILLSDYQIRSSDSYIVIPSSAYTDLAFQVMEPNAIWIGGLTDEELLELLMERHYHSDLSMVEDYLDGNIISYSSYDSTAEYSVNTSTETTTHNMEKVTEMPSEPTTAQVDASSWEWENEDDMTLDISTQQYDDEILRQILTDVRNHDGYLYIDPNFNEDSYITTLSGVNESLGFNPGDMTLVYSPYEEKFYSSYYGWYMIPDELYFLTNYMTSDLSSYYIGIKEDDQSIAIDQELPGEALFWLPFADRDSLLRVKLGEDYMDYIYAVRNLTNRQQNFLYYMDGSDQSYGNVDNAQEIMLMERYLVITKMSREALDTDARMDTENDQNGNIVIRIPYDETEGLWVQLTNIDNYDLANALPYVVGGLNSLRMEEGDSLYLTIRPDYSYFDEFRIGYEQFNMYYKYMIPASIFAILMLVETVVIVIASIKKTGYSEGQHYLYFLDRWPVELMWLMIFTSLFFMIALMILIRNQIYTYMQNGWSRYHLDVFLVSCGIYYIMVMLGMTGFLSMVRRLWTKEYEKISLFRMLGNRLRIWIRAVAGQRNLVAQAVEMYLVYWLLLIISTGMLLAGYGVWPVLGLFLFVLANIGMLILSIRKAKGEQIIRTVTQELADGNLEVEVPKGKPLEVERQILSNIERLGDGLHTALEQSIYDERMKAELITNVSHDIKTPLTSIINYVDLLKREDIENEEVRHYIEVLDQKSRRLKQLTEDLVEVSKLSSGNIELECMPIDFGELVRQSMGEFQDKFQERNLQIVDNISEEPCVIYADGRRTYRVMDNLMQNVYKYAMPNTRVYIDLMGSGEMMIFSIKNISQAELNIDANELMERFIRGDQSRSTEGSGLGLSIAKDLVHLQNGAFDILLDGDLFKVTIMFPLV